MYRSTAIVIAARPHSAPASHSASWPRRTGPLTPSRRSSSRWATTTAMDLSTRMSLVGI